MTNASKNLKRLFNGSLVTVLVDEDCCLRSRSFTESKCCYIVVNSAGEMANACLRWTMKSTRIGAFPHTVDHDDVLQLPESLVTGCRYRFGHLLLGIAECMNAHDQMGVVLCCRCARSRGEPASMIMWRSWPALLAASMEAARSSLSQGSPLSSCWTSSTQSTMTLRCAAAP